MCTPMLQPNVAPQCCRPGILSAVLMLSVVHVQINIGASHVALTCPNVLGSDTHCLQHGVLPDDVVMKAGNGHRAL